MAGEESSDECAPGLVGRRCRGSASFGVLCLFIRSVWVTKDFVTYVTVFAHVRGIASGLRREVRWQLQDNIILMELQPKFSRASQNKATLQGLGIEHAFVIVLKVYVILWGASCAIVGRFWGDFGAVGGYPVGDCSNSPLCIVQL